MNVKEAFKQTKRGDAENAEINLKFFALLCVLCVSAFRLFESFFDVHKKFLPLLPTIRRRQNPNTDMIKQAPEELKLTDKIRSLGTSELTKVTKTRTNGIAKAKVKNTTKIACATPHHVASRSLRLRSASYSGCAKGVILRGIRRQTLPLNSLISKYFLNGLFLWHTTVRRWWRCSRC